MARQLLEQQPKRLEAVKELLKSRTLHDTTELSNLIVGLCECLDRVYFVMDALDEFALELEQRLALVAAFSSLRERLGDGKMRLCITTRTEGETKQAAGSCTEIEIRPNTYEIELFIADFIKKSPTLKRLGSVESKTCNVQDEVERAVLNRSDRMYVTSLFFAFLD